MDLLKIVRDAESSEFSPRNLPYCVFSPPQEPSARVGVRLGNFLLDMGVLESAGLFKQAALGPKSVFNQPSLNAFIACGKTAWHEVRRALLALLSGARRPPGGLSFIYPRQSVLLRLPVEIGDYTDFYASKHHASNVGEVLRGKDQRLLNNWLRLPVAYHGRASSIVVSGAGIRRPWGQTRPRDPNGPPEFSPSARLDFELEVGYLIGPGNSLGDSISIKAAEDHIFGLVLLNDWSARDIQSWEYQPLGPFLGKNFATTISPWVVPLEALQPYRVAGPKQDPAPLPYLQSEQDGAFDIQLEAWLTPPNGQPHRLCYTNFSYLYWSMAQQIAHHTSNGCNLRPGDLLASGTVSGPEKSERGCLLELTWGGDEPIDLGDGNQRVWLQDGDELTITGWCEREGARIGFGSNSGRIIPAHPSPQH